MADKTKLKELPGLIKHLREEAKLVSKDMKKSIDSVIAETAPDKLQRMETHQWGDKEDGGIDTLYETFYAKHKAKAYEKDNRWGEKTDDANARDALEDLILGMTKIAGGEAFVKSYKARSKEWSDAEKMSQLSAIATIYLGADARGQQFAQLQAAIKEGNWRSYETATADFVRKAKKGTITALSDRKLEAATTSSNPGDKLHAAAYILDKMFMENKDAEGKSRRVSNRQLAALMGDAEGSFNLYNTLRGSQDQVTQMLPKVYEAAQPDVYDLNR